MKMGSKGLDLVKSFEGLYTKAYKCPAGVWTIGYGHTKGVKRGQRITKEQAVEYLKWDIQPIINYLNKLNVCKTQGQFGALVSFIFNLGVGNFQKSDYPFNAYRCGCKISIF